LSLPDALLIFATMLQKEKEVFSPNLVAEFGESHLQSESHSDAQPSIQTSGSDFVGISGSILCLIHCLAPQLIGLGLLGAGIGAYFAGEIWALIFWITCLWAVNRSAKSARYPTAALALWASFLLFSSGLGIETFFDAGKAVSYSGSVLLILAHVWNYRLQIKAANVIHRLQHEACCGSQMG
jgi:hypothetical protein